MKAIILAAGRGARLAPLTDTTPKPLLPINGQPLIVRQLQQLRAANITNVVINLYHLGDLIERALGNGEKFGMQIAYSHEQSLLETGGGIKKALPLLEDDEFVVCNGDIYTDFNFSTLPKALAPNDSAHLVLTSTPKTRESGDFDYSQGRVTNRGNNFVYCGISIFSRRIFGNSPEGAFSSRDLLFEAMNQGQLSAQIHRGQWTDIGTLGDYQKANDN
jgi:MurNAc alpha-1-phosphate uridylyltransferase|tara:strand:- start:39 stop:692 length:654 start_codon:yes stop_codon:yes gene_type:complete